MKLFEILKEEILTESGIRIPKGSTSAKILYHKDLDGLFSAILTVNQLEKQGIQKSRINLVPVQYGDDNDKLYKDSFGKKGQFVSVVDFSSFPQGNAFNSLNMVFNYKLDKTKFLSFVKKYDNNFKTMSEIDFKTKVFEYFSITEKDIKEKNLKELTASYRALKHFDFSKIKGKEIDFKTLDKMFETKLNNPDFVSDHHDNAKGDLTPGKSGKIGATNFKSDAEHISTVYAQNLADYSSIKAITTIDSAAYEDLENTILLKKDFREKGRMERLVTITSTLVGQIIKHSPDIANHIILNSAPSVVSVYNNCLKYGKFNDTQLKMYEEMKKENPNWDSITSMKDTLPKSLQKNYTDKDKYKSLKPLLSVEEWRKKGIEDMKKALSGFWTPKMEEAYKATKKEGEGKEIALETFIKQTETTLGQMGEKNKIGDEGKEEKRNVFKALIKNRKEELKKLKEENKSKLSSTGKEEMKSSFSNYGNVMVQKTKSPKEQPSRFAGSLLEKGGFLSPFVCRVWSTMIQFAVNPQVSKAAPEAMKDVDLGAISTIVLNKLGEKYTDRGREPWWLPVIKRESGGHKFITTISALATVGLAPAAEREKLEKLKEIKSRITKVGKKFETMMPMKAAELKVLELSKEKHSEIREEALRFILTEFSKILWEKYKNIKVPGSGKYSLDNIVKIEKETGEAPK